MPRKSEKVDKLMLPDKIFLEEGAIVLLSGGLDSTTVLAYAQKLHGAILAISFDYGQRHKIELQRASKIASKYGVAYTVVNLPFFKKIGHSALTDLKIDVPENRSEIGDDLPATYVPARNIVFLSTALAYATALHAKRIYIGANALDYSGYPDCRPNFIKQFETMARLGTDSDIVIDAPLIDLTKAEIIELGTRLGVDYSMTSSCYNPQGDLACGVCDSCLLRKKGFAEAGIPDPTKYMEATC